MRVTKRTIYNTEDFDLQFKPIEDSINIKKTKKGYTVKYLVNDTYGESPREWDNFGTMICFHNRYDLGDKTDLTSDRFNGWEELETDIKKELKYCLANY